jgi:hypothetical protein
MSREPFYVGMCQSAIGGAIHPPTEDRVRSGPFPVMGIVPDLWQVMHQVIPVLARPARITLCGAEVPALSGWGTRRPPLLVGDSACARAPRFAGDNGSLAPYELHMRASVADTVARVHCPPLATQAPNPLLHIRGRSTPARPQSIGQTRTPRLLLGELQAPSFSNGVIDRRSPPQAIGL